MITVGAGWYLYIYLNSGDVNYLANVGYAVETALICSVVTGFVGTIACAAVAATVWYVIQQNYPINRPGYCLQIKLTWVTWSLAGDQWVQRNC